MANPHPKCHICGRRHAQDRCALRDRFVPPDALQVNPLHSLPIIAVALTRICDLLEKISNQSERNH